MVTLTRAIRRSLLRIVLTALPAAGGACGGAGEPVKPQPAPVARVVVAPVPATIYVGATVQLSVTTLDAAGAVLTGRTITYSSLNTGVATVSASGVVTPSNPGAATIQVASEGKSAEVPFTVTYAPVASVLLVPAAATVGIGGTIALIATPRDSVGGVLYGRTITWTSSAPAIATVSATGSVSGLSAGTAAVRATIEGKFSEAAVTVSSGTAPSVTGITPALLTPGITATITGTGFGGLVTDNVVSIDGVSAPVASATATRLTVVVPALPCLPSHSARVQVVAQGLGGTTLHPVRAGTPVAIETNVQRLLSAAEAACAELPAGTGRYLVSVVDLDMVPTSVTGFRLAGALPPASVAASLAAPTMLRQPVASRAPAPVSALAAPGATSERMHDVILEQNRATYARLRGSGRFGGRGAARSIGPTSRSTVAIPAIGDTRKFRVSQFSTAVNATGSCSNFVEVTARVAYVGTHSIIYEDVAAPLANTMDSYYRALGAEFDQDMFAVDSTYFGNPLITDPGTDMDGHLNMVFTPSMTAGVAGFVTSCDFYPRSTSNQVSNLGENFYAIVPTVAGTGFSSNTAENWLRGMRHTIVHEVKHISSFGARIVGNAATYEESWLEEGMARHAEELWARNDVYKTAWKANTAYRESLYCDVRPSFAECAGKPYAMFNHFSTLYNVLDTPGATSLFGRVTDGDFSFYAASWSLVRYAIDRYAGSEAAFLRGVTQSTTTSGLVSIAAQTGHSSSELLANWSLALYLDDSTGNPDLGIATWNTHDIYAGMNQDFGTAAKPMFQKPFPLVPLAFGSPAFAVDNGGIHGGSFSMYLVPSNAAGTSTLHLGAINDTGMSASALQMVVVRIP